MNNFFKKELFIFLIFLTLNIFFYAFLIHIFYPIHFVGQKPIFWDLIEFDNNFPFWFYFFVSPINLILIWLIAKKIFSERLSLIPVSIYCLSPWSYYLTVAGSFYILILSFILIIFLGILELKANRILSGVVLFTAGSILSLYSSIFLLIMLPFFIVISIKTKFITFQKIKPSLILIIILCLPLFISIFHNRTGIINIFKNQITIFSDSGLITAINNFQGESKRSGFKLLSKVSENKYVYLSKYIILKLIKNITPVTFFTSQEKLLNFSFTPPILLGFLIPFLYGMYLIIGSKFLERILISAMVLILPSLFSKNMVDLNRLILVQPLLTFITSFGLIELVKKNKIRAYRFFLFLAIFLVITQFLLSVFDVTFREYPRYEKYYGLDQEIGLQ